MHNRYWQVKYFYLSKWQILKNTRPPDLSGSEFTGQRLKSLCGPVLKTLYTAFKITGL